MRGSGHTSPRQELFCRLSEGKPRQVESKVMVVSTDTDPRLPIRGAIGPIDEVEEVIPDSKQPKKKLKIEKYL